MQKLTGEILYEELITATEHQWTWERLRPGGQRTYNDIAEKINERLGWCEDESGLTEEEEREVGLMDAVEKIEREYPAILVKRLLSVDDSRRWRVEIPEINWKGPITSQWHGQDAAKIAHGPGELLAVIRYAKADYEDYQNEMADVKVDAKESGIQLIECQNDDTGAKNWLVIAPRRMTVTVNEYKVLRGVVHRLQRSLRGESVEENEQEFEGVDIGREKFQEVMVDSAIRALSEIDADVTVWSAKMVLEWQGFDDISDELIEQRLQNANI